METTVEPVTRKSPRTEETSTNSNIYDKPTEGTKGYSRIETIERKLRERAKIS